MHAGVMMTATPPHVVLQAALDAGLLDLQHKALNATSVRPVQLDMDVLRLVRAREHSAIIGRLLSCAQRSAYPTTVKYLALQLGTHRPNNRQVSGSACPRALSPGH